MAETWTIPGVPIFQEGVRRGKLWTKDELEAMASNLPALRGVLSPPIVIGHGDEVDLGTGAPKLGTVENLRVESMPVNGQATATLVADFVNMPAPVADMISAGLYDRVSSEIQVATEVYDESPEGCEQAQGPILRRVALLGGELPQIKTLGDLTALMKERGVPSEATFSERIAARPRLTLTAKRESLAPNGRLVAVFSEIRREATVKKCKPLSQWSDASKATLKKFAEAPASVSRDDLLAMLTDAGVDAALMEGCPDAALQEMVRVLSMTGEQSADDARDAMQDADKSKTAPVVAMSEMAQTIADLKAAMQAQVDALKADLEAAGKLSKQTVADHRLAGVHAFCEKLLSDRKITPAMAGLLPDLLGKADAVTVVKFGEQQATAYEGWRQFLELLPPVIAFGEKVPVRHDMRDGDPEESKVLRYAEDHKADFAKLAQKPADVLAAFKVARDRSDNLTASEYLGVSV